MSFNLVDLIKNELGDVVIDQVSSLLGEPKESTENAVNGSVAGILDGLLTSSSKEGGAAKLANTLSQMDDGLLGNFASMLSGGDHSSLIGTGTKLLGSLMGNGAISKIATAIAGFSGIKSKSATSLIGLVAPLILSVIRKKMSSDNLDANGLLSMLQGQKDNISKAMPAGMLGITDNSKTETYQTPRTETTQGPRYGKLLWIPLLLLIGLLSYFLLPKLLPYDSVLDAPLTSDTDDTISAIDNEPSDYVNIGSDLGNIVNSVTDTLSTVTDADTATKAAVQISEATSKISTLSEVFNKLPGPAKSTISSLAENKISTLESHINKVVTIPGVGPILKPSLDTLMQTLTSFSVS
ncbi:MAG: DUF937 domain-containing protein [Methylococcaceae bacterium]|nr:DUF937 domain-containing protein [Methylococcaceae bacterium]